MFRRPHHADNALACSFCHKPQDQVQKLISSPSDYPRAYICDECISVCNSILVDTIVGHSPDDPPVADSDPGDELDMAIHSTIFNRQPAGELPPYSTDLAAAWTIVHHLERLFTNQPASVGGFMLRCAGLPSDCVLGADPTAGPGMWSAHFHTVHGNFCARADTPALAICRAAMRI